MNHAARGDQFIRRIGIEAECRRHSANRNVERPDVHSREFRVAETEDYPAQLTKFRDFPQNNRRDSPRFRGQRTPVERMSPFT